MINRYHSTGGYSTSSSAHCLAWAGPNQSLDHNNMFSKLIYFVVFQVVLLRCLFNVKLPCFFFDPQYGKYWNSAHQHQAFLE